MTKWSTSDKERYLKFFNIPKGGRVKLKEIDPSVIKLVAENVRVFQKQIVGGAFSDRSGFSDGTGFADSYEEDDVEITVERELTEEDLAMLRGDTPILEEQESDESRKVHLTDRSARLAHPPAQQAFPPSIAQWMVTAILPENRREAILGDLEECFSSDIRKFGKERARNLYRARVIGSYVPLVWQAIKQVRLFGLIEVAWKCFHG